MARSEKQKKQYKVSSRPILSLLVGLGFITIVLIVTMISASKGMRNQGPMQSADSGQNNQATNNDQTQVSTGDTVLAVVKEIDTVNHQIQLFDVSKKNLIVLSYSGGTNLTDKYGQIISMNQIEPGIMVDIKYQEDKGKLTDMNISTKAWEYVGVSNLSIDQSAHIMKIANNKYKFEDDVLILDNGAFIPVSNLAEQDELTIRGNEETIWSITVTRGHGVVILQDYEEFIGDYISIGYEAIQQISDHMEITVREGNFNLTVDHGDYSATKNITVYRNQESYVTLSDLGPDATAFSQVRFNITPFGADLYIDGHIASYANPVELAYGKHAVKVAMGGYTTYEGTLEVNAAGKSINIDLPESTSSDEATVSESDSGSSTTDNNGTSNNGTTGSSTDNVQNAPADYSDIDPEDIDENHKIFVQEPSGASVYLDGSYMCVAPGSFKKIIGTHVITFIKEGYQTMSYTVEVSDDKVDTYFTFPALTAE